MEYKISAGVLVEWQDPFTGDIEFRRVISVLKIETTLKVERGKSEYILELEPKELGRRSDYIYSDEIKACYKKVEEPILKTSCRVTAKATDIFKETRSTPIAYL